MLHIMLHSVVYLRVSSMVPNYNALWEKGLPKLSTGSGCVIQIVMSNDITRNFILTNAHCIQDSSFIECLKPENSGLFIMSVYDICPELDLALLEPKFNKKSKDLELGENSELQDFWKGTVPIKIARDNIEDGDVIVVGFPQGGINPSFTRGIISRYTHMLYNNSVPNIAIQIDAAVNSGNSGGPVFNNKSEMVGIAFSHQLGAQNMCYMIPISLIHKYINDVSKNNFSQGVCDLDIEVDLLENPSIRNFLLPDKFRADCGVIIRNINVGGSCDNILQNGDILYKIDETFIGKNGTINIFNNCVPFWYLIRLKYVGEEVKISYIRDKKECSSVIILKKMLKSRVPKLDSDISKQYYIFAGMVFQSLSYWCIFDRRNGEQIFDPRKGKLYQYIDSLHEKENDEIVVLSQILPSEFSLGYKHKFLKLNSINDIKIHNLHQVYKLCESKNNKYIKFEFSDNHIIVLKWKICLEKSASIANRYIESNYHNFSI
jgi:S1-C subfamily serine protease